MNDLIKQHKNLIESEAAKYAKWLPHSYVEAEAYHIANEAAKSYDPSTGNKFSTHLQNQLKQLGRLSTEHGSIVRTPEHTQYALNRVHRYMEQHKGEHGVDATVADISANTHIPLKKVNDLLRGKKTNMTLSSAAFDPAFVDEQGVVDDWIHMVYHDLPQQDKHIFENFTGFGGKPAISEDDIAKKLNIDKSLVKKRLKVIGDEIAKGLV
jgi:DNA-directed RNA polymerase specialized sigma subunit